MRVPIFEETYRSWHGRLEAKPRTWWVIARTGARLAWRKAMIILLLLASVPFLVRAVQIYLISRMEGDIEIARAMQGLQIDARFFAGFLRGQTFFLILVLILAGAGLIANDRKFRALTIYFSKPVGFWDYVAGKFLVIGFYGGLVTLVPGLALFILKVLMARDAAFLKAYYWIPAALLGQVLLALLILGGVVLALSSAARGARPAAIAYFAVLTFPDLLREILPGIPEVGLISLTADLRQTAAFLFGLERPFGYPVGWGLAAMAAVLFLSLGALWAKVKPTEVIR